MSAEVLRRAAELMRGRARLAEGVMGDGRWSGGHLGHDGATSMTYDVQIDNVVLAATPAEELSFHIASWHPTVALAVADWLDACALVVTAAPGATKAHADRVARAYLGEKP